MPWAETSFSQSERRPPYHIQEASFCVKSCKCKCKICRYLLQHYCPSSQAARQWVSFDGRPLTGSFQSSHWLIKEKGYCQKISCNIHMPDALVRKQSSPLMTHLARGSPNVKKMSHPVFQHISQLWYILMMTHCVRTSNFGGILIFLLSLSKYC